MKRMGLVFAFWLFAIILASGDTTTTNITTMSGFVCSNVVVTLVEPDGITLMLSSGLMKVPFTNLAEDVREAYGYDPAKALAYSKGPPDASAAAIKKQQAEATEAGVHKEVEKLNRNKYKPISAEGTVSMTLDDGAMLSAAKGFIAAPDSRDQQGGNSSAGNSNDYFALALSSTTLATPVKAAKPMGTIFVLKLTKAEGCKWKGTLYFTGSKYSYKGENGSASWDCYALSAMDAASYAAKHPTCAKSIWQ
jgi:hypothetical protein